jgi:ADP-ribosylation factor-like protein 6
MAVVKNELDQMLTSKELSHRKTPILFFANKMDDKSAMTAVEVARSLELEHIKNKPWHICASCALTGEGLGDGIEWITGQIRDMLDSGKK